MPCAVGGDVAVNEAVHMRDAPNAGKMAEIAAKTFAVPVVAEEIVQQRGADDRCGFAL